MKLSLLQCFNLFAGFATIITAVLLPFHNNVINDNDLALVLGGFICCMLVLSWALLILQEFRYSRKARYAEAAYSLHQAVHSIRDALFVLRMNGPEREFNEKIIGCLQNFAAAMSLVTQVNCRACIKRLYCSMSVQEENIKRSLYVETPFRSEGVAEPATQEPDWITENTDFLYLFLNADQRRFLSNNLLKEDEYRNSHWPENVTDRSQVSYVSTMVWPIRKLIYNNEDAQNIQPHNPRQDIIGYLCIDSATTNVFVDRFDTQVGAMVADALYSALCRQDAIKDANNDGQIPEIG